MGIEVLLGVGLALAGAIGAYAGSANERRATAIGLALAAGLFVEAAILNILNAPFQNWNYLRLVASFALKFGQPLYFTREHGALISGLNTPLQPLAFLPATIAGEPSQAVTLGCALSAIYFFIPALFFFVAARPGKTSSRAATGTAFLLFGLAALHCVSLRLAAFLIHADAPGVGLSAVACACLLMGLRRENNWRWLTGAALAGVSAPLCKITYAPIVVVLPFYAWLAAGGKTAVRLLALLFFAALIWGGALLVGLGPEKLWFHFFSSNFSSPWISGLSSPEHPAIGWPAKLHALFSVGNELLQGYALFLIPPLVALTLQPPSLRAATERRRYFRENPWTLCSIAALAMVPPALLARVKAGGVLNTQTPCTYFLVLGATTVLFQWAVTGYQGLAGSVTTGKKIFSVILALTAILQLPLLYSEVWPLKSIPKWAEDTAFHFAQQHRQEVYFPFHPLATLMSDGRVYHSGALVSEYQAIGLEITPEHFRAELPPHLRWVALENSAGNNLFHTYLSEFTEPVHFAELPGWDVFQAHRLTGQPAKKKILQVR
jgi:hypothetical protein